MSDFNSPIRRHRRFKLVILLCVLMLTLVYLGQPTRARADGGGFPTRTPTVTQTPEIPGGKQKVIPTLGTPYPAVPSSQPASAQNVAQPKNQPKATATAAAQAASSNIVLRNAVCMVAALIIVLAGVVGLIMFRSRARSSQ